MPSASNTADKTLAILAEATESKRVLSEPDLPLFDAGLLDSFGVVTLIDRLSEEFNLDISPMDLDRANWATPAKLVADIERRLRP
jgi:D-alanine--poly(phosphoribitol) ligase subunit 2